MSESWRRIKFTLSKSSLLTIANLDVTQPRIVCATVVKLSVVMLTKTRALERTFATKFVIRNSPVDYTTARRPVTLVNVGTAQILAGKSSPVTVAVL